MATKKKSDGIAFSVCSICEKMRVTLGSQRLGGIRYCAECMRYTLGWFQMTKEQQENVTKVMAAAEEAPRIKKQKKQFAGVTDELAHAISIGESRRRLMQAYADENRD